MGTEGSGHGFLGNTGSAQATATVLTAIEEALNENRRQSQLRPDIWIRMFPLKTLIQTQYNYVIESDNTPPYRLLTLGKLLLKFINDFRKIGNDENTNEEVQEMLNIFDKLFARVLITKFDKDDDYDGFLDLVWTAHSEGTTDFSGASVIPNLLKSSRRHLVDIMSHAMETRNPQHLHKTALMDSEVFREILNLFHQIYNYFKQPPSYLTFCRTFFNSLPCSSRFDLINHYPTAFHPLFFLICSLPTNSDALNNSVLLEILALTNDVYENHPRECHSYISFLLKTHESVFTCLSTASDRGLLTYPQFPYLWDVKLLRL